MTHKYTVKSTVTSVTVQAGVRLHGPVARPSR
jgi:hypothetical protein